MFQDDRMIPVLTVLVLMLVMGTVLQRVEGLDRWLGGEAPVEIVLRDDEVTAPANLVLRIDVFANDEGIDEEIRESLKIVTEPACGRLQVRSGALEYIAGEACKGRHTIRYAYDGAEPGQVASVTARIVDAARVASAVPTRTSRAAEESAPRPEGARAEDAGATGGDGDLAEAGASPPVSDLDSPDAPAPAVARATGERAPVRTAARTLPATPTGIAPGQASPATPAGDDPPLEPKTDLAMDGGGLAEPVEIAARSEGHSSPIVAAAPETAAVGESSTAIRPAGRPGSPEAHAPANAPADRAEVPVEPRPVAQAPAAGQADPAAPPAGQSAPAAPPAGQSVPAAPPAGQSAPAVPPAHGSELASELALGVPPLTDSGSVSPALAGLSARPSGAPSAVPSSPREAGTGAEAVSAAARVSAGSESWLAAARSGAMADPKPSPAAAPDRGARAARIAASAKAGTVIDGPGPGDGEDRLAALPSGAAEAPGLPGESASAEPMRPGVRLAALLPPPDADRPSLLVPLLDRDRARRGRPSARPNHAAAPGNAPLAAHRPAAPRAIQHADRPAFAEPSYDSPVAIAASTSEPAFVLAIFGHHGENATPAFPETVAAGIAPAGRQGAHAEDGVRLAALAPPRLTHGPWAPGSALDVLPVVPEAPPSPAGRMVMPVPRPVSLTGVAAAATPATDRQAPAYPDAPAPCATVPGLILDVRNAGITVLGVDAPCHAGTVAELTYSGLSLAVPLDGNGQGSVTVLGFEPNTPALVTFSDGASLDFELPFRDVDLVSRVALAWDSPVELGLNALERGAAPNSPGHVRPGAARSLEEARQNGGGYLSVWWPVAGVGQSVQVYSWYHRRGERPGVVRMLVDFVSRDRDHLDSACGTGRNAAPQFMVLRSEAGRPERPVVRRLTPLDCRQVAEEGQEARLIAGAVEDLVITSR